MNIYFSLKCWTLLRPASCPKSNRDWVLTFTHAWPCTTTHDEWTWLENRLSKWTSAYHLGKLHFMTDTNTWWTKKARQIWLLKIIITNTIFLHCCWILSALIVQITFKFYCSELHIKLRDLVILQMITKKFYASIKMNSLVPKSSIFFT